MYLVVGHVFIVICILRIQKTHTEDQKERRDDQDQGLLICLFLISFSDILEKAQDDDAGKGKLAPDLRREHVV